MEPLYRSILKQAWSQIKKHRWLWLFGLFAAFMGNGGEVDILMQNEKLKNAPEFLMSLRDNFAALDLNAVKEGVINALATAPLLTTLSVAVSLIFVLLFIWLVVVSQGALIESASKLDGDKKVSFRSALEKGIHKFWPVFGLNLSIRLILYFALIILSIPFAILYMYNNSDTAITFLTLLAFILLVPIAIILSFILKYAFAFVVVKDQSAISAFVLAWRLFATNWLISLEMAILLFAINFLVGLILVLAIVILALPFLGLVILMILVQNEMGINLALGFGLIITLLLLLFTGSGLAAFQYSAWTLLFQKLLEGNKQPKLLRLVSGNKKNK